MPDNDPQQNTLRPDNAPAKKQSKNKAQIVKDVISKGRTATGQKPDEIIINPVLEEKERHAVFAFGRFNPPTTGHEKLIHKVEDTAKSVGGEAHIIASHTVDNGKNPIPKEKKVGYLKKVAGEGTNVRASSSEHPTLLHQLSLLHKSGVQHLTMVAGSDRVKEYHDLINKYNGQEGKHGHYNFKSIKVVSAGHRDPDAEGAEGMSGTKMREHARSGNIKAFKSGLPKALHPHAEEIMNHIKSVKEDVDNLFDDLVLELAVDQIGQIYDQVIEEAKSINYDDSHFRDDGAPEKVILFKHDTPGEPKSPLVKDKNSAPPPKTTKPLNPLKSEETDTEFNNRFGKYREAVPRSGQNRKEIDLVPRDGADRKKSDKPYRQQSIVKKIIDENEITMGKGPPDNMSSPSNDTIKQVVKLPKATMPDWDKKGPAKLPNVKDFTPDMFKSEANGKRYKSPWQKIMDAAPKGTEDRINKSIEGLKQNAADYQAILDKEKAEKEKKEKVSEDVVNSAGSGGVRGMGYVSGNVDGEGGNYVDRNIEDADTHDNILKAQVKAHHALHAINNSDALDIPDSDTEDQIMNKKEKKDTKEEVDISFKKLIEDINNKNDPVKHLENKLNTATDKSHNGIDKIMREVAKVHNINVNDLHDKWVKKAGCTPDEYVKENVNEDLRKWFKDKWVRFDTKGNIKGQCAREPGEGKPKCLPQAKAQAMDKEDRATAARRKRREDPVADRSGKGGSPVFVKTEAKNWSQQAAIAIAKKKKQMSEEHLEEKNTPTNPALWSRAKALARSKFDVYPSAYANGWASKWYKSKGGGWKSTNEETVNEISNELIGKVNKIRSLYGPKSKTAAASDTLNKAVEKVRRNSEVGKVKDK